MALFGKGSKLYSIFNLKCPRCHEADMFETGSFSFNKPFDMKLRCDHCNENFMPEPGFYYGAMFISYIFTGFFCIGFIAILHWGLGMSTNASFGLLIFILAIFFVYIFRLARAIWININVKYDPNKAQVSLVQCLECRSLERVHWIIVLILILEDLLKVYLVYKVETGEAEQAVQRGTLGHSANADLVKR